MQADPGSIFATARDITVTGGMLFIITSSYFGKFQWTWQVDKQLAVKELQKQKDMENAEYREVAWGAISAARQGSEVGQQLVAAVRERRGR
jgi:hypothetical protein